ncbi:hypothetical protein OGAPHI_006057 [Ogataea philodendri]|uniref:AP complex mu/sigma subunit domain-containing protein n=1 Tax=Ogataea philodendri TaxID=1378263 RepID=A0A9P8T0K9_9ASCO|nr:uncharacterized protein OGAPHI_006057 [Ogataea philodendri]KAH3661878.1 hypothetical protein OGAPHI_006057 [Ogataea philodendri]
MAVDVQDNELSYLEMVHLMVEVLDSYFNNVCELDIIFNFYKVYQVLDEMFLSGEFQETIAHSVASWGFFVGNTSLLTHSRDDSDQKVLTFVKVSLQFITQLSVWGLDVILGLTVVGHQVQVTIVNVQQLELGSSNEWNLHVVGRWGQVLQLLLGEDVKSNQVDLGVTVLTSLGSGHVDNLAWSTLDNNETVLSQGRTLHWVGQRGTSISGLEGVLRR